ncbi:unnamed protein product, partial [Protopolystoma xenopodis]
MIASVDSTKAPPNTSSSNIVEGTSSVSEPITKSKKKFSAPTQVISVKTSCKNQAISNQSAVRSHEPSESKIRQQATSTPRDLEHMSVLPSAPCDSVAREQLRELVRRQREAHHIRKRCEVQLQLDARERIKRNLAATAAAASAAASTAVPPFP